MVQSPELVRLSPPGAGVYIPRSKDASGDDAMAYRRMATILLACALGATQAQASDDVSIETFDGLPIGTTSDIVIYNTGGMFDTTLSGGEVVAETTDFPAHSGTQVYR